MTAPRRLEDVVSRFQPALEARLAHYAGEPAPDELLARMAGAHLASGGKRLRGLIPVWVADSLGAEAEAALDLGAGLELLHNATLVHDDVQDGDTVRRGQDAMWVRFGVPQAINLGDALYFQGLAAIAAAPAGPAVLPLVCRAMLEVVSGQVLEFQLRSPSEEGQPLAWGADLWERIARGKTGALFGACFAAGIAAGRGDAAQREEARSYGESLGLLFQLQDDLLDLAGDKGRQRRGTDIAEGKLSYPVGWAAANAAADQAARLRIIVDAPREETSNAMVDEGLAIVEGAGGIAAAAARLRELRGELVDKACDRLVPGLVDRILAPVAHVI